MTEHSPQCPDCKGPVDTRLDIQSGQLSYRCVHFFHTEQYQVGYRDGRLGLDALVTKLDDAVKHHTDEYKNRIALETERDAIKTQLANLEHLSKWQWSRIAACFQAARKILDDDDYVVFGRAVDNDAQGGIRMDPRLAPPLDATEEP